MTTKPTENQYLKLFLERKLNKPVSEATWYRIKQALVLNDIAINENSLAVVAEIKNKFGNAKLSLTDLISGYFEATTHLKKGVTGEVALKELRAIVGVYCAGTTILRWFVHIPKKDGVKFSLTRIYTPVELYPVYLKAYVYAKKYSNKSIFKSLGA